MPDNLKNAGVASAADDSDRPELGDIEAQSAAAERSKAPASAASWLAATPIPGSILSIGSIRPMTPVEQTSICSGLQAIF